MPEPRCELSELLVSQCDHCRKGSITLDDSKNEGETFSVYQEKQAKYSGTCSCKRRFRKGDIIAWSTQDEWWRARKCCPALFE